MTLARSPRTVPRVVESHSSGSDEDAPAVERATASRPGSQMPVRRATPPKGRTVSMAYAAMSLFVVVLVLAVAYGTSGPQFGVAEFAPTANEALDAPPTTGGPQDSSTGGGRGRRGSTSTTAALGATPGASGPDASAPPTTRVGRGRNCVGNPPRQIEDRMSPPCIATMFEGDNGGATSVGVTDTEIRIGVPNPFGEWSIKGTDILFEYFNQTFEFYGRRLVPVYTTGSASDAAASRALGAEVASQNVFGALTGLLEYQEFPQVALVQELARAKVVTVVRNYRAWWSNASVFDAFHPFVWSSFPPLEDLQANLGDFACTSLSGRKATNSGEADDHDKTRRFAVLQVGRQVLPKVRQINEQLERCTGEAPLQLSWTAMSGSEGLRSGMEQIKAAGATTLICVCDGYTTPDVAYGAHGIDWHPEWIVTSGMGNGNDEDFLQNYRSIFGGKGVIRLSAGPRLVPIQARPIYSAIVGIDDKFFDDYVFKSGAIESFYDQLLVLASGIQLAGPQLTPDAFSQGLMSAQFPNPDAGAPPVWQASVGFGPGDHSFLSDYMVAWWSDTAPAIDYNSGQPVGSWCYLGQGARFQVGRYPANGHELLFNADVPCR